MVDTLACAIWALLQNSDFEETLAAVVNLGGDEDTVEAVSGGPARCEARPPQHSRPVVEKLEYQQDLLGAALELHKVRDGIS